MSYDLTVANVPAGVLLNKATLMVKASLDDADEDALIIKHIFPGSSVSGQILNTGASGTGLLRFVIDNNDVDVLEDQLYISGVKVRLTNGFFHDVEALTALVRVRQPVVRDVSALDYVDAGDVDGGHL